MADLLGTRRSDNALARGKGLAYVLVYPTH